MKKKREFLCQEKRDEYNRKAAEIQERMIKSGKKEDLHETYNEALKEWLPEAQRSRASGAAYFFLCQQLKRFLEDSRSFYENQASLRVAKENFESYCEMKEKV